MEIGCQSHQYRYSPSIVGNEKCNPRCHGRWWVNIQYRVQYLLVLALRFLQPWITHHRSHPNIAQAFHSQYFLTYFCWMTITSRISVIGIYGLIIAVILAESIPKPNVDSRENSYSIYTGMAHVSETWWLLSHLTLFCESCHLSCIILTNNCTCISGPSAMCWPVLWTVRTRCWGLYRHCGRIWRAMCGLSSIEHYTISVETRIIWIFVSSWSRHWWRHWRFVREWRPEQTLCWNVDHADFFRGISIVVSIFISSIRACNAR